MNKKNQVTCILRFCQPWQCIINLFFGATRQRHTCRTTGRRACRKRELRNPSPYSLHPPMPAVWAAVASESVKILQKHWNPMWCPVVEKILHFFNLLLFRQGHRCSLHLKVLCGASGLGDRNLLPCVEAFSFPGFKLQFWNWTKTFCRKKTKKNISEHNIVFNQRSLELPPRRHTVWHPSMPSQSPTWPPLKISGCPLLSLFRKWNGGKNMN